MQFLNQAIYVNDEKHENLTAYNIDGYTYFKLRDIGEILNFSCTWMQKRIQFFWINQKDI